MQKNKRRQARRKHIRKREVVAAKVWRAADQLFLQVGLAESTQSQGCPEKKSRKKEMKKKSEHR
jgi:hypothetical protein